MIQIYLRNLSCITEATSNKLLSILPSFSYQQICMWLAENEGEEFPSALHSGFLFTLAILGPLFPTPTNVQEKVHLVHALMTAHADSVCHPPWCFSHLKVETMKSLHKLSWPKHTHTPQHHEFLSKNLHPQGPWAQQIGFSNLTKTLWMCHVVVFKKEFQFGKTTEWKAVKGFIGWKFLHCFPIKSDEVWESEEGDFFNIK